MHDEQVVLACELDDLAIELGRAHAANGVCGKRDDHVLGTVGDRGVDARHIGQKIVLSVERIVLERAAGEFDAGLEHGVARVGHEHAIALVEQRQAQMAHALLRTVDGAHHIGRDAVDVEATLVVIAYGLLEFGQVTQGVLPHLRILGGLCERLDHMVVRGEVRRTDREVVDSAPLLFQLDAAVVESGKDLVAKAVETAGKLHGEPFRTNGAMFNSVAPIAARGTIGAVGGATRSHPARPATRRSWHHWAYASRRGGLGRRSRL